MIVKIIKGKIIRNLFAVLFRALIYQILEDFSLYEEQWKEFFHFQKTTKGNHFVALHFQGNQMASL